MVTLSGVSKAPKSFNRAASLGFISPHRCSYVGSDFPKTGRKCASISACDKVTTKYFANSNRYLKTTKSEGKRKMLRYHACAVSKLENVNRNNSLSRIFTRSSRFFRCRFQYMDKSWYLKMQSTFLFCVLYKHAILQN